MGIQIHATRHIREREEKKKRKKKQTQQEINYSTDSLFPSTTQYVLSVLSEIIWGDLKSWKHTCKTESGNILRGEKTTENQENRHNLGAKESIITTGFHSVSNPPKTKMAE